jgi:hypothetical protein
MFLCAFAKPLMTNYLRFNEAFGSFLKKFEDY